MRILHIIFFLITLSHNFFGQKYNFVNWTVEDGLIQSQATFICQDKFRQLWIGTSGGVSKFDGKTFTGYALHNGLISNRVNILVCDSTGNIWIGTNFGISVFNGRSFTNIKPENIAKNNITAIAPVKNKNTYVIDNNKLYCIKNYKARRILVSGDSNESVTSLYKTQTSMLAYVNGRGIYFFDKESWHLKTAVDDIFAQTRIIKLFISAHGDTLLVPQTGIYCVRNNKIGAYNFKNENLSQRSILSMVADTKGDTWFGTDRGVYKEENAALIHYDAKSGCTDNSINNIYKDAENNLWFATDADGIYKFRENTFTYYDKSSGLANPIIMGVAQTSDRKIYAGGYGGSLYRLTAANNLERAVNAEALVNTKVNAVYADDDNNLWIGALSKGAWKYNETKGLEPVAPLNKEDIHVNGATVFLKDARSNILIGGSQGLFIYDKNKNLTKIKIDNVTALKELNNDSVLVGTTNGIYVLNKNYEAKLLQNHELKDACVLCIAKTNNHIWIGTIDKGVLNWNIKTGRMIFYNINNGLPSNYIYSILISDQQAWIGTGFGISNFIVNSNDSLVSIKNYGRSDGLLGMECSHNCLLKAADSSIWFGTTKGLFHFNPRTSITEINNPVVQLKSVKLFSSEITDSSLYTERSFWFNLPQQLKLKFNQNHLTFELGVIYFTNPQDVLYRYKLIGLDEDFTTSSDPTILYPGLPPGQYTLQAMGVTKGGIFSSNTVNYAFVIEKAFYQTRIFLLSVVLLLITIGGLTSYFLTMSRQKRKRREKDTLARIREEEFSKLRHRAAEDFHDEMGNSLTRISLLTDVLRSKTRESEGEVKKLISQIKESTTLLYNGSRDIIWSLNSKNDGIYEIAEHLREIGTSFFEETEVEFYCSHTINSRDHNWLKLDCGRNLTMIFKEACSNILKHANASKVLVEILTRNNRDLEIKIIDDGKGFDLTGANKGNGIKNIISRVTRLNGEINIDSAFGKGTEIKIVLINIFT